MISIIIPTYNEELTIKSTMDRMRTLNGQYELIVADGGSQDKTVELAAPYARVINTPKGRGQQMNCGASHAQGHVLWFVHSDSRVDENSVLDIEKIIGQGYVGGCFSLEFYDSKSCFMRWLAWTSNLRAKHLKLMFGDQGIFVKRDIFEEMKGYEPIPIMEDWDFSKRLFQKGRVHVHKTRIGTSGRRFEKGSRLKTLLKMHWIKWKYLRGMPPEELIGYYKEIR